ncbi:unnamed protein product [Sphagnum balticum]
MRNWQVWVPDVVLVLTHLQPVNPDSVQDVFSLPSKLPSCPNKNHLIFPSRLKIAQILLQVMGDFNVQVVYVLSEEDNGSLLKADAWSSLKLKTYFLEVFGSFKLNLGTLQLSESDLGSQVSKELLLEKTSDLVWASCILPRVGLNLELVDFWSSASIDVIRGPK